MSSANETIQFSVNDIVKEYSEKDFVPSRAEPRSDVFFEFRIAEANLDLAKKGYLQVSAKCNALDANGGTLFTKYMNLALPVSYKGVSPHPAAKSILQGALRALHPELAVYDSVVEDAATGKKVYMKNGSAITGKAYDAAVAAQAAGVTKIIDGITDPTTSATTVADLVGRTFFAKVETDKTGQYSNIKSMLATKPTRDTVAYDRATGFTRAD